MPVGRGPVLPVAAYDPKTDTWTNKANIPTGRVMPGGLCRGWDHLRDRRQSPINPSGLATVEAYDPKTNQWTRKSNLPKGLLFLTASVVNG